MRNPNQGQVLGIPVNSSCEAVVLYSRSNRFLSCQTQRDRSNSRFGWITHFSKKADTCSRRIQEHVKLGHKIIEAMKGKLSLGARILQAGGVERVFRQLFTMMEGEKFLKAFQCYLSTSSGPIAGLLFISTTKVAFHSERRIRLTSANGDVTRIPYKVVIPIDKIRRANSCENISKPKQKYIQIMTVDDFEFWFMGFLGYQRTLRYLQTAMLQSPPKFL